MRTIKCCFVVLGITLMLHCFLANTSSSSAAINKLRRLPATTVNSPCSEPPMQLSMYYLPLQPFTSHSTPVTRWSHISSESRFLPTPPASTPPFGWSSLEYRQDVWDGKKTTMALLSDGRENLNIYLFVLTEQNSRTWQTDRHRMTK